MARQSEQILCIKVHEFAKAMQKKLRENKHKSGWKRCTKEYFVKRLHEEIDELANCADSELLDEAADIANFLMMYCDNKGALNPVHIEPLDIKQEQREPPPPKEYGRNAQLRKLVE